MNETKQSWSEIRDVALAVLEERGDIPEVTRQVEALVGSVGDTLPDDFILEELRGLQAGGPTFRKVIADDSPRIKDEEARQRYKLQVIRFTKRRLDPNSSHDS
jgi:hypothetical protein